MVELKKEAVKDVTSLTKAAPVALAKTKEVLNQAVADLYVAHVALHQVHWYMRGRGFLVWHPKWMNTWTALMAILTKSANVWLHLVAAHSLLWQNSFNTAKSKKKFGEFRSVEESLERVLDVYRYLITLFQKALDVTDEEGDDVTNDIFVGAKAELEKTVWMLAAELGQAPGL